MDVREIAVRARVGSRTVRYVLAHEVMPGYRGRGGGAGGRVRSFTVLEGFWVGVAALLYERGVRRHVVADALRWLADAPWPPPGLDPKLGDAGERVTLGRPRSLVEALWRTPGPAVVSIGDAAGLRVEAARADSGWRDPRTWAPYAPDYAPRLVLRLDLAALRAAFADARD